MRSKCVHEKNKAPCQSCLAAGISAENWYGCFFFLSCLVLLPLFQVSLWSLFSLL